MVMTLMSNPRGAVGTVVIATDGSGDTTDIQTGINMLPATGGCVYIKEGTYTITATITITIDNVSITGCGRATRIDAIGVTAFDISGAGCHLENFWLHGDGTVATYGIYFSFMVISRYTSIINMWIDNFDYGIRSDAAGFVQSYIRGNTIYDNLNNGIHFIGCADVIIADNIIISNENHGIFLDGSSGFIISSNDITENLGYGIYNDGCVNNVITGNRIEAPMDLLTGNGIYSSSRWYNISSNFIVVAHGTAVYLDNLSQNHILSSNYIYGVVLNIQDLGTNNQIFNNIET